ncbi:MAG: DUF3879 family protein [Anaerotignum sp.]
MNINCTGANKIYYPTRKSNGLNDFMAMGTVKNAVMQQKAKDYMTDLFEKADPQSTYTEKFTVCGVDVTDNPDAYKVIVPLSENIKNKLDEIVRENLEQQGHVSKTDMKLTEKRIAYQTEYLNSLKQEDRPAALWSIGAYLSTKTDVFEAKIRQLDPKWDWGRPVKEEVLDQVFGNKLDISI